MEINEDNLVQELKKKNVLALEFMIERYANLILKVSCNELMILELQSHFLNLCIL